MRDAAEKEQQLERLVKFFEDYLDQTQNARKLSERDRDFYDGNQWTSAEISELQKRGQPVVVINRIAPRVNYIRGYEVRTRIDPRAYPRTPSHEDAAIAMTDALRYVADREKFDSVRSFVTENLLIEGYGGAVVFTEVVGSGEDKQVEICLRHIPYDQIFFDPRSKRPDFSDAKYLGVTNWWYLDDAKDDPIYGATKEQHLILEAAAKNSALLDETHGDKPSNIWFQTSPERVRIDEVYWVEDGKWMVAHHCRGGFLVEPKKVEQVDERGNNYCPLILTSSFINRQLERYGIVRNMISPQEEINKRRSKAMFLMNVRQIMAEESAVPQPEEARIELAKPDGYVQLNQNALSEGRFVINNTTDLAQGQFQLLAQSQVDIDRVGPAQPVVGDRTSGRQLQMQMQSGSMELEPIFDNLRDWQHRVFRAIWYCIRQFWPEERWIRVRDDASRQGWRFVALNKRVTRSQRLGELVGKGISPQQAIHMLGIQPVEAQEIYQQVMQAAQQQAQAMIQAQGIPPDQVPPQAMQQLLLQIASQIVPTLPAMQKQVTLNDVNTLDCDIILDATPDTTVVEQEEFESLVSLAPYVAQGLPLPYVRLIIEASQVRKKRELLEILETKPDPIAEQAKQLQVAQLQANVEKTKAQAMDEQASAQQRMAEAQFQSSAGTTRAMADAMASAAKAGSLSLPSNGGFRP